jgi:dihydroorotate dehydrogenase
MGVLYDSTIKLRNGVISFSYKHFLKPIYFRMDPESIHDRMIKAGKSLGKSSMGRGLTGLLFNYQNDILKQEIKGITFNNPVGLAAGFDKNAELYNILPSVGFGHAELGSVTGEYCPGNPKPRLWRLPKSESLVVYYGLKNDGAQAIHKRLEGKKFSIPIGISVAKTNCKETVDEKKGIEDYKKAYDIMEPLADYITINISCPNAFGGEPFQDPIKLERLLKGMNIKNNKLIFIKLPYDVPDKDIDEIIAIARKYNISGFVCTNLSKYLNNPKIKDNIKPSKGGLSGRLVQEDSDELIRKIYSRTRGEVIIIGVGGIFNAKDAYRKIKAGANLVQMITGMVYVGPTVVSDINLKLSHMLKNEGYGNIIEAIGADNKKR